MFRFPARHLALALTFLFLVASTAPSFAQGAKVSDATTQDHPAAKSGRHDAMKKSRSKKAKHAISREQREKIAEEMQESKRAHDHPAEAQKFYLSRRLPKGMRHI